MAITELRISCPGAASKEAAVASTATMSGDLGERLRRLVQSGPLHASELRIARREIIYGCMDNDRSIYLIERGQVKSIIPSREGKECLLAIYIAGDVFGELCLIGGARTEMMIAMTATVVKRICSTKVLAALDDAGLREELIRYLARRLLDQQHFITDLVTADSEYRLAGILLHLARKIGRRDRHLLRIDERITQEELAAMVGTTRSRVGFFLKRFLAAGLLARPRGCFLAVHESRLDDFLAFGWSHSQPVLKRTSRSQADVCQGAA